MTTGGWNGKDALQLAFDLSPVGFCMAEHRVLRGCNPAFEAMFGYGAGELAGRSLEPLYPSRAEYLHIAEIGVPMMMKTGEYGDERIMKRRDGSLFWCHVVGRGVDRSDPLALAVWMFEDISARRPVGVQLTPREREIASHIIKGCTSKQIAKVLGLSPRTVEAHRARLMKKVGAVSHGDLIARLLAHG